MYGANQNSDETSDPNNDGQPQKTMFTARKPFKISIRIVNIFQRPVPRERRVKAGIRE